MSSSMSLAQNVSTLKIAAGGHEGYHNYDSLTKLLHGLSKSACQPVFRYFSIGQSVQGRELWTVRLTDKPDEQEEEPEFLYVGNIHGDETLGRELLIQLVKDVCDRYVGGDEYIRWLVESTDIYIVLSLNPDGYEAGTRANYHDWDLNRNFPDQVTGSPMDIQPETRAMVRFLGQRSFALGANLHAGTLCCNYPWDDRSSGKYGPKIPSISPDDSLYRHLCSVYSDTHPSMHLSKEFPQGITNGAAYFAIYGGLQDYSYGQRGMLHVTLELGYTKTPPPSRFPQEWADNTKSLYTFMEQVHSGVRGRVRCTCGPGSETGFQTGDTPANASLTFERMTAGLPQPIGTPPLAQVISTQTDTVFGDYHRVLLPGAYRVTVRGCGGVVSRKDFVVYDRRLGVRNSSSTVVDFTLLSSYCQSPVPAIVGSPDGPGSLQKWEMHVDRNLRGSIGHLSSSGGIMMVAAIGALIFAAGSSLLGCRAWRCRRRSTPSMAEDQGKPLAVLQIESDEA